MKKVSPPAVKPSQFHFGYKNQSGAVAIAAQFDLAGPFVGEYAPVARNGKWGVIDQKAKWICEPKFEFISRIEAGLIVFRASRLFGLAKIDGTEIIPAKYDEIISCCETSIIVKSGGRAAVVDLNGKARVDDLDFAGKWSQGYAAIAKDNRMGVIDASGAWLVKPQYDAIYDFKEGFAGFEDSGKAGYLDLKGNVAIAPKFDATYDFSEGLARVKKDEKFGYIDTKGKLVIPCKWGEKRRLYADETDVPTQFYRGFAEVARLSEDDFPETGYLDREGNWHDSLPETAVRKAVDPELTSYREQTPEWEMFQEAVDLGPTFEKKLSAFNLKLAKAMEKDEPATTKAVQKIIGTKYEKSVKYLDLMIYDTQEVFDLVVYPNGEPSDDPATFTPFKALAKAFADGIMDEPKSKKGVDKLRAFHDECTVKIHEWFAKVWQAAEGKKLKVPAYVRSEDTEIFLDLQTGKRVAEKDLPK